MSSNKIGYIGSKGSQAFFASTQTQEQNSNLFSLGYSSRSALLNALNSNEIDQFILDIENSLSGTFLPSIDFLLKNDKLKVIGEVVVDENNVLAVLGDGETSELKEVVGEWQTVQQLQNEIESLDDSELSKGTGLGAALGSSIKNIQYKTTKDVVNIIESFKANKSSQTAIICNPKLAKDHGLKIIHDKITSNQEHNFTRYFIVALKEVVVERHQLPRTTIAISLKNAPGALMKVFSAFAQRDINVFKVESRASVRSVRSGSAWEYIMIVDVDGAPQVNEKLKHAIDNLYEFCTKVQILGSYPRYFPPPTTNLAPVGL